jgi:hypothetical protein
VRTGSKACPFCFSKFTFEEFELVDSMPADKPCDGCVLYYAILDASARRKAEMRSAAPPAGEPVDLSSSSSILARLLENRRRSAEPEHDARMAAAGRDAD